MYLAYKYVAMAVMLAKEQTSMLRDSACRLSAQLLKTH